MLGTNLPVLLAGPMLGNMSSFSFLLPPREAEHAHAITKLVSSTASCVAVHTDRRKLQRRKVHGVDSKPQSSLPRQDLPAVCGEAVSVVCPCNTLPILITRCMLLKWNFPAAVQQQHFSSIRYHVLSGTCCSCGHSLSCIIPITSFSQLSCQA